MPVVVIGRSSRIRLPSCEAWYRFQELGDWECLESMSFHQTCSALTMEVALLWLCDILEQILTAGSKRSAVPHCSVH